MSVEEMVADAMAKGVKFYVGTTTQSENEYWKQWRENKNDGEEDKINGIDDGEQPKEQL